MSEPAGLPGLAQSLKHGKWGQFFEKVSVLGPDLLARPECKLPCLVVLGSESDGKSSLLENLTQLPIFPRQGTRCTTRPIRLRLEPQQPGRVAFEVQGVPCDGAEDAERAIRQLMPADFSDKEISVIARSVTMSV